MNLRSEKAQRQINAGRCVLTIDSKVDDLKHYLDIYADNAKDDNVSMYTVATELAALRRLIDDIQENAVSLRLNSTLVKDLDNRINGDIDEEDLED